MGFCFPLAGMVFWTGGDGMYGVFWVVRIIYCPRIGVFYGFVVYPRDAV